MQTIQIKQGQCLLDIAMQYCGSADAAMHLAALNSISITDDLIVGSYIKLVPVLNNNVVNYYTKNNIIPASNDVLAAGTVLEGIGYMQIENDFKVY